MLFTPFKVFWLIKAALHISVYYGERAAGSAVRQISSALDRRLHGSTQSCAAPGRLQSVMGQQGESGCSVLCCTSTARWALGPITVVPASL